MVVAVAMASAAVTAAPGVAGDLGEYLEKAADADYAGRRVVVSTWDGGTEAEVVEVEHAGGMMMIADSEADVIIGGGKVAVDGADGVALSAWSVQNADGKYATGDIADVTRLGRSARSVTVYEGDTVRARIVFDLATWAPLATEIYDGDGSLFRLASFTEFDPAPQRVFIAMKEHEGDSFDVVAQAASSSLPAEAGGYDLLDSYMGSDGVAQGFYGDGLFSFSVFVIASGAAQPELPDAADMTLAGERYLVLVEPSEVWVSWQRGTAGYVLVGDLPPDHLERVLAALPTPKRPNLLQRFLDLFD